MWPGANVVTFEIGAGTGTATRRLLELGANPLIALEPDDRLATFLRSAIPERTLTVLTVPFEEAGLPEASFDLGLSATAFHWLTEELALTNVATRSVQVGGGQRFGTYSEIRAAPIPSPKPQKFFSAVL